MSEAGQRQWWTVSGFKASALSAGLKKDGSPDLGLIFSEVPASAAGVFTTSRVRAAPVVLTEEWIAGGTARAILANAGNANACTGDAGREAARMTAQGLAEGLGLNPRDVLLASTGVIGEPLKADRIVRAVPDLIGGLDVAGLPGVARAIMTTDTFPKIHRTEGKAGGRPYRIVGVAKGSGMIMPDMATMLAFALTDIHIEPRALKEALNTAVGATFNRISVDGDTSTNDTVLVLASGMAKNPSLSAGELREFTETLKALMAELSRKVVLDGEGATKLVDVRIRGALTRADALTAARVVANSPLVKTAFYGEDPNWGRILAALGRSGITMAAESVDIWFDEVHLVAGGELHDPSLEERAAERMRQKEFTLMIDLNQGEFGDHLLTCDLSHEYIRINAEYRS